MDEPFGLVPLEPAAAEAARLDALYQLRLLDTPASESFDRVTRMVSQLFALPIAAVSLTDRDRQWFKSRVGLDHVTIPREGAPCAQVAETRDVLVIPDFLQDPFYRTSGLAAAGIRFYAGAPLVTREGHGLGSLCVLGTEARDASPAELAALVDLAAIVMAQIELQHALGRIDPVSGMPNRNQFIEDMADASRDYAGRQGIAVVVDLARNDQVNKMARVIGSSRVDEMVNGAARSIRAALSPDRKVYHVGATQFGFLSPLDVEPESYLRLLTTTFEAMRSSSTVAFVTTVAVGLRPFRFGEATAEDVLRGAHGAAQDARATEGAIAIYSADTDSRHHRQYRLLHDFGAALTKDDQLRLVFQPRIDLATGMCIGAEALLRWCHPVLGEIGPSEFIPIIEHSSLARPTTQWVLDAAMRQIAAWNACGRAINLSVNISAANLAEHDFVTRVQLAMMRHGVRPSQVEVELTESAIMENQSVAIGMLEDLASTGISLAIDDFGTGYSSLAYLQVMPVRVVKIDQAFIRDLTDRSSRDFAFVQTILTLSHRLGYRVVAEGVETIAAADVLRALGCDEAQGYYFARPLEADRLAGWVDEHHHPFPEARTAA